MASAAIKPDTVEKDSSSMPEVQGKFAPGELTPSEGLSSLYGFNNKFLPKQYQDALRGMVQKVAQIDMYARIEEVKRATEQRFYWRGQFDVYFDETNFVWEAPQFGGGGTSDSGDVSLSYAFNIYQSFGDGFISQVGILPRVNFEATDKGNPNALRISASANSLFKHIEFMNDGEVLAEEVARLMYTDGRVGLYSRWVTDGSLFGYEDQDHVEEIPEGLGEGGKPPKKKPRQPKGGERINPFGVLELKTPLNMRRQSDFPFLQLSYEIDLNVAKAMFLHISSNISGGEPGPGEYNFDRTSRIAVSQGVALLTQTGDTVYQLPTYQRTWIRPSFFASIEDDNCREFFEDNFPDGAKVTFIGDTYAESVNESMDDHWKIMHARQGDGQATPSVGRSLMDVQDCFNDLTDLQMETFMKSIPAIYGDKGIVDFKAIAKEKAGPGAHYPTKRPIENGEDINKMFWAEPEVKFPAEAVAFYNKLLTDIPQFLSGINPVILGEADPSNKTKGGILALMDASKGRQGNAWKAFRRAYAEAAEQLVRIGAYYRAAEAEDGRVEVTSPGQSRILVDLEDLNEGNFYCVPVGDESYPRTEDDRKQALQVLITAATAGSVQAQAILNEPKNAGFIKDRLDPDMEVPGADETVKQMAEIEELLGNVPVPNSQIIQAYKLTVIAAVAMGKPAPPQPGPEVLYRPSVDIDPIFDVHDVEFKAGQDWINSPAGQQAKREDPDGFMNVRLHLMLHQAQIQKAAQAKVMQAVTMESLKAKAKASGTKQPDKKTPSETINFKDLGPSGQFQVAAQAGLDISADVAADLTGEHQGTDQA